MSVFDSVLNFFFGENFPDILLIAWLLPVLLILVVLILELDFLFKKRWDWKVGYSRKFFHFFIFSLSGIIQYLYGVGGVFILGWSVSFHLLHIIVLGTRSRYYHLLGRPEDAPQTTKLIIFPYLATFLGGVFNNIIFGPAAVIAGYLVVGLGDAVGEPVGTRWGRHRYPVINLGRGVKTTRSWEGSLAVFLVCILSFVMVMVSYDYPLEMHKIIIAALLAAIIEGISPHGWDNFTSQVTGAILMHFLLT